MRRGYAEFNYSLKNQSIMFCMSSIILLKWAKWFWDWLRWHELAEMAAVCRQYRRARLVMLIKGATPRATKYWRRLELLTQCRCWGSVMERIMWFHDVRETGKCGVVLERVGELHDVCWEDGNLAVRYPAN